MNMEGLIITNTTKSWRLLTSLCRSPTL